MIEKERLLWGTALLGMALLACGQDTPADADAGASDAAFDTADEDERTLPEDWDVAPPDAAPTPDVALDQGDDGSSWPDLPLAPQNQWGPSARVTRIEIPASPDDARQEGCYLVGSKAGTGLNSVVNLAGGLDQFLAPNAEGLIQVLLYGRVAGWLESARVEELNLVEFQMLYGEPDPSDGWYIARHTFVDGDPDLGPRLIYPNSVVDDGWLEGSPGMLDIHFSVIDLPVSLSFSLVQFHGRLFVDGPGFGMRQGVLTAYMTEAAGVSLIRTIQEACNAENPPGICGAARDLIGTGEESDEEVLEVAKNFVGGFDTYIEDGAPSECDPEAGHECNALSVCMIVDMEGIEIAGVGP
jgi:hypothetical protein